MHNEPTPSFTIALEHQGTLAWRLTTHQLLPLPIEEAFIFFGDPRNLNSIIPDWLEFTMGGPRGKLDIFEGAELNYTFTGSACASDAAAASKSTALPSASPAFS